MNLAELERKLWTSARRNPPACEVPYGFAKRVMGSLATRSRVDGLTLWAGALWRAAGASLAVAVVLGAFTLFLPDRSAPSVPGDLSQAFERTLLAAVDQETDYVR